MNSPDGPRLRAAVLGATGLVGQRIVRRLIGHPWFELVALAASERSAGRRFADVLHGDPEPFPPAIADLVVASVGADLPCDIAFSALDAETARAVEPRLAARVPVVSNAGAFRQDPDVPLLVPEINPGHLALVRRQHYGRGCIVTNPNCSTAGLVCALKPLDDTFGVERVLVTTLQAASGAGYPGVSAVDLLGNVVPHISGEVSKLESEPVKILGRLVGGGIAAAPMRISAQVNRVPVLDGHLLSISVKLRRRAGVAAVRRMFEEYRATPEVAALPSAPHSLLHVLDAEAAPQPRRHAELGEGMTIALGQIRACPVLDVRFVALVHNLERGAAGAAVLNGELMVSRGVVRRTGSPAVLTATD